MLNEQLKRKNRDLYEDVLKNSLGDYDTQDTHMVEVYHGEECVFREQIPVFLKMTNYQVWGEYQIIVMWEESSVYDDISQYKSDGLHGTYSSNFVTFKLDKMGNALQFNDEMNVIRIFL